MWHEIGYLQKLSIHKVSSPFRLRKSACYVEIAACQLGNLGATAGWDLSPLLNVFPPIGKKSCVDLLNLYKLFIEPKRKLMLFESLDLVLT